MVERRTLDNGDAAWRRELHLSAGLRRLATFYGPIFAAFLLGMLTRRTSGLGVKIGILMGIAANLCLWLACPRVSWLWWNAIGCGVTVLVGYGLSLWRPAKVVPSETLWQPDRSRERGEAFGDAANASHSGRLSMTNWRVRYMGLVLYTLLMIGIAEGIAALA